MTRGESNAFIQLRHYCATLGVGNTERPDCPWCGGGDSKEKAFAVTRTSEAEARYICNRASCGRSGRLAVWGFNLRDLSDSPPKAKQSFTPRLYTSDTYELGDEWAAELLERYEITRDEAIGAGWRIEVGSGLLVCPTRNPLGLVRGYEVRRSKVQIPHVAGPKTKSYRLLDEPWLGWYRTVTTSPTVAVEDHISALKVSRHFQTVCLHGSHINEEQLLEIISVVGNKPVVVALDGDATYKAVKFIAENRFIAPNFRAVVLSKDMKFMKDKEIVEMCQNA